MSTPMSGTKRIVLYGPPTGRTIARGYGGGVGGYTRNMEAYLALEFLGEVRLEPLFHTVRGERTGLAGSFPVRFLVDCWRIASALLSGDRPNAVHVLASYRRALPREVVLAALCRMLGVPLIYDIKAGAFMTSYQQGSRAYRAGIAAVLRSAAAILVEGRAYRDFLAEEFGLESVYVPNFVLAAEVPASVSLRLTGKTLKLLYVGFCCDGKGVPILLRGCAMAAATQPIDLTLIGEEDAGFKAFADAFKPPPGLRVRRLGRRAHADVLAAMAGHDVYCYPSLHPGEGHNNSINEAMMHGMVIMTTRQGFLADVLGDDAGYWLSCVTPDAIAGALRTIAADTDAAREKARLARARLIAEFTSCKASERLSAAYARVLAPAAPNQSAVADIHSVPQ